MPIRSETQPIFPAVFKSSAGWVKEAIDEDDLTESSKDEAFEDWIGGEILDSAGKVHRVISAKFTEPDGGIRGAVAYLLERIQYCRTLELETIVEPPVDIQEFKLKLKCMYPGLEDEIESAVEPEEAIRLIL